MATNKEKWSRAMARLNKLREDSKEAIQTGVAAVEITSTAAALSYLRGRFPAENKDGKFRDEFEIAGIPVDLVLGVGMHALAFAGGVPQQYAEHAHNIGNGALAVYAANQMFKIGRDGLNEARKTEGKAALPGGTGSQKDFSPLLEGRRRRAPAPGVPNGAYAPAFNRY